MKKYSIVLFLVITALGVRAQNRKNIANFSLFQQYFNPALTGHEGSLLKTFYRNQWTGFDKAPVTFFLSGEFDPSKLKKSNNDLSALEEGEYSQVNGSAHSFGLSLLVDSFGPLEQNQVNLSYGTGVRLNQRLNLRVGGALTYDVSKLNANQMTMDEANDPEYNALLMNDNKVKKLDGNIGLVLTANDYYVGYAIQDIAGGKAISGNQLLQKMYPRQHVVQAGYRKGLTDQFGVIVNGIYRYDSKLKETIEGQVKGVVNNTFWAGMGYRNGLAINFLGGVQLDQIRVGYVREITSGKAQGMNGGTNEIMFSYNLVPIKYSKLTKNLAIW